jgi:hypothetical protein
MKTLRTIFLLCCAFTQILQVKASTPFRISLKGKKFVNIQVTQDASVEVKGYPGDDLIITGSADTAKETPKGFTDISALATPVQQPEMIGKYPYITETPESIRLVLFSKTDNHIVIQVPEKMTLFLTVSSRLQNSQLSLSQLTGELKISGNIPAVLLSDISGPVSLSVPGMYPKQTITVKNVRWHDAPPQGKPWFYISTISADVVLCVPRNLKASFGLDASHNRVYSTLPPDLFKQQNTDNDKVMLTANGGGPSIYVTNVYGNIILKDDR